MSDFKNIINPFGGHLQRVVSDSHIVSVASSLSFKDGVADVASLPAVGNTTNDARIVNDTHNLYIWDGSSWVDQGDILNIDWSNITSKPSASTADIDLAVTHKDLTNNPHSVTASQAGAYTQAETNTLVNNASTAIISLAGNAYNYLFAQDVFYTIVSKFIFKGTTILGTPSKIKLIAHVKTAIKPGDIRIYDVTNATVIGEVTGIANTSSVIVDLGTLSNLPTGESIFEVQLKDPSGDEIRVSALIIEF